jgi:hypothetical protein
MDYWDNYEGHYHENWSRQEPNSARLSGPWADNCWRDRSFSQYVKLLRVTDVAKANGRDPPHHWTSMGSRHDKLFQIGVADELIESIIAASATSVTMPASARGNHKHNNVLMYDIDRFNYPTPWWARTEPLKQLAKLALMAGLPGMPKKEIACEYFSTTWPDSHAAGVWNRLSWRSTSNDALERTVHRR